MDARPTDGRPWAFRGRVLTIFRTSNPEPDMQKSKARRRAAKRRRKTQQIVLEADRPVRLRIEFHDENRKVAR